MTQADRIKKAVGEFGKSAKAKFNDPSATGQPEDQLRNPLETLLTALAAETGLTPGSVTMVGETSLSDLRTRPDFSVSVKKALVGFIEVKAPGKGADPRRFRDRHDKEQWDKLKALPNLLYTDGNDFSLWRDGVLVGDIVRLVGDIEISGDKLQAPDNLLPLLNDFLSWQPIPPRSVPDLARVSARLCRFLRDEVVEQLGRGSKPLEQLAEDWRALLFPQADDAQFADGYAQAVTFGLLMAKSMKLSLADGLDKTAKALGRSNSLIGAALRLLTEEQEEEVLGPSLKTLTRVLDVVDWDKIAKGGPEAWLYFYEDFLEVYDNKLRKLTGSYYTPPEIVQAMVRLCDEALRSSSRFGVVDGLAGEDVHIADPAMGSGTFLLGVLRQIAQTIEANHGGPGAVGPMMGEIAPRLIGFELQFGAFAVAQLRLLAEMIDLGGHGSPQLFVTDTLSDPNADIESGQGIYREISNSQRLANQIKRTQPITVVIGNPPYKEKAKGKGAWIESGSGNKKAPLLDWQPPGEWKVGAHAKHLRNLYVYFWRWAAWKVFEQGAGGRDQEPPVEEKLSGIVCYITVAGFLNGPGFQKMRSDLRRDCDEIWVIDCSPEGHQPEVATRIFQGVQHPICIVLASRSPSNDPAKPARVRFRALARGHRKEKFEELSNISLDSRGWSDCPATWRAPFLPEFAGGWADFVPIDEIIGDSGSGVMPGRTWIIAPDAVSLQRRWQAVIGEPDAARRAYLFHPHEGGDKTIAKASKKGLTGHHAPLKAIETLLEEAKHPATKAKAIQDLSIIRPVRYGFRSFDRQWIIPDNRLINRCNPSLWDNYGPAQVHLCALMGHRPTSGPACSATSLIPDMDHYKGSFGGRVFALWKDPGATESNVLPDVLAQLAKGYGHQIDPVEVFTYVAALLSNPAYTQRFRDDLIRPGLRVPLTADAALFADAAELGREALWLHTFGDRFAEPAKGRPASPPRLPLDRAPFIPKEGAISSSPESFPDSMNYDAGKQRLLVGAGFIENVPQSVWEYEVSGKPVLRQWFSYRRKNRERPQIGDKRPPSPLGEIQPDRWLPEYTSELINLLNVLAMLVELEPKQADLLERICDGPLIPSSKLAS